jgi:hypothetical protein
MNANSSIQITAEHAKAVAILDIVVLDAVLFMQISEENPDG